MIAGAWICVYVRVCSSSGGMPNIYLSIFPSLISGSFRPSIMILSLSPRLTCLRAAGEKQKHQNLHKRLPDSGMKGDGRPSLHS